MGWLSCAREDHLAQQSQECRTLLCRQHRKGLSFRFRGGRARPHERRLARRRGAESAESTARSVDLARHPALGLQLIDQRRAGSDRDRGTRRSPFARRPSRSSRPQSSQSSSRHSGPDCAAVSVPDAYPEDPALIARKPTSSARLDRRGPNPGRSCQPLDFFNYSTRNPIPARISGDVRVPRPRRRPRNASDEGFWSPVWSLRTRSGHSAE